MSEDVIVIPTGEAGFGMGARLYPNLEGYQGELQVRPWDASPKQEVQWARDKAVAYGRRAERSNELIRGGLDKNADMVVGPGLMVRPTPEWDLLGAAFTPEARTLFSDQCRAWFNNWAYDQRLLQDAEGTLDFGGLMWLAYRNTAGPDGESFGGILYDEERRVRYNGTWATYVNVLHPSRIATPPMLAARENVDMFQGKLFDDDGRWVALTVMKNHPSDPNSNWDDWTVLPRETATGRPMAWHIFGKTQAGAQRGITTLATMIRSITQLDTFYDAHLGSAVLNSLFAMFIKSDADTETVAERLAPAPGMPGGPLSFVDRLDFYSKAKIRFGGKRVPVLPNGDEIKMENVNRAADDPQNFVNLFLRSFASVTGTTFEQVSNNWSDANYSSARAALLDLWRSILRKRTRFSHAPSLCYSAVMEEAIDRRRIILPAGAPPFVEMRAAYTKCAWMGPGMGQIDPEKEAKAQQIRLQNRTTNREIECAEDGLDYYDVFEHFALEVQEADDLEFTLEPKLPGAPGAVDTGGDPTATGDPVKPKPQPAKKSGA